MSGANPFLDLARELGEADRIPTYLPSGEINPVVREAVEGGSALRRPKPYPGTGTEPFNLLSVADLNRLPDLDWLVEGILPAGGLVMLHGHPEAGKSFVALDWSLTLASGATSWCGRTVRPGRVVYVGAEAVRSLKPRVAAWQAHHQRDPRDIRFIGRPVQLLDLLEPLFFRQAVAPFKPDLVVVDTFSKCLAGGDDSSSKDVSAGLRALDRLREETGTAVLFLHHNVKGSKGERGSGVFRADVDMAALLTAEDDGSRVLTCTKMRDAQGFGRMEFTLEDVGPSVVLTPASGANLSLQERVVNYVRSRGEANLTEVRAAIGGRAALVDEALDLSVRLSVLTSRNDGRARVFSVREKPRRTGTDG